MNGLPTEKRVKAVALLERMGYHWDPYIQDWVRPVLSTEESQFEECHHG